MTHRPHEPTGKFFEGFTRFGTSSGRSADDLFSAFVPEELYGKLPPEAEARSRSTEFRSMTPHCGPLRLGRWNLAKWQKALVPLTDLIGMALVYPWKRATPAREAQGHHHGPEPFKVVCDLATGTLEIVDTPRGERIRLTVDRHADDLTATVIIDRPGGPETLALQPIAGNHHRLESTAAPAEPHEFQARLILGAKNRQRELPFKMVEPEGHHH